MSLRRLVPGTAAVLAAVLSLSAAELRPGHPRMFFNADTWPAVKARAEGPAKADLAKLLRKCDRYPSDPVCSGMGPVVFGEVKTASGTHRITAATPIPPVKEWGSQAAECALAWRFTGKPDYLAKAKRMLEVSAAAYLEAYRNGREVCWYTHSRILALCAYDWIFEALADAERRALILPLMQHVEDTQRRDLKIVRRNTGGVNTGFYGVESLPWYAGLAAAGDGICDDRAAKLLATGLARGLALLKFRDEGAGDDGALSSAVPGYCIGAYPWAHFNFLHTYRSAYGENLAPKYPGLALFPNWIHWTWIPNAYDPRRPFYCGFGDDPHLLNEMPTGLLGQHMAQYMLFWRDANPAAAGLAAAIRDRSPAANLASPWPVYPFLLDRTDDVRPTPAETLEKGTLHARHFENLGQFILRSGWTTNDTYCTFTAGAKLRMHKHHDENNFVIYHRGFLALDSGTRGVETDWNLKYYYAQSVAHNVVLIHKPGEELPAYWGPRYQGPEGKVNHGGMYDAVATPKAFETGGDFTYIASDATACYGRKCTEAVRQFVHLLPGVFVVYDRVGAADPSYRKEWLLHTQREPETVSTGLVRADCEGGRLFCETLLPEGASVAKVGGPGKAFWAGGRNWDVDARFLENARRTAEKAGHGPYFGDWRLEVAPPVPSADDRFLHVLTATDTSVGTPVAARRVSDADCDGVVLTVPDHVRGGVKGRLEATFRFRRTGSVGGDVRLVFRPADGSAEQVVARPLATALQPQAGILL